MNNRVLIVDDESSNRKLLKALVVHEGLCPVEAGGGQKALDLLQEQTFALVLLDMMMPGVDGMAVLQRLRDLGIIPDMPVVVVTAHNERELRLQALALGAIDFMSKPLDVLEMRCRLRTLVELGRLRVRATQEAAAKAEESLQNRISGAIGKLPLVLYQNPHIETGELGEWPVEGLERLTGQAGTACFENLWNDLVHPQDRSRIASSFQDIVSGRTTDWHLQYRWSSNGNWVVHVGKFDSESRSLVGALLDISETKHLEAKYLQSQKMEAVGQLAGGIAHDFNNLLCAIISFAGFARDGLQDEDQCRADIDEVLKAADRAAGLTRQLLTFSRRKRAANEVVDLNERLSQLHKLLTRTLGEQIHLDVTPSPRSAVIEIDPVQFDQVVLNLAVNARDAMPNGGTLKISLDFVFATDGPKEELVRLTVTDNGIGMDSKTCKRVFEPFFTTKEKGRGTGLGLATCFAIVEQASGQISLQSVPSQGTTFTILWPLSQKATSTETPESASVSSGAGHSILVVEDEAALRRVMKRVLESAGYRVYTAVDGEEGKHKVDLLEGRLSAIVTDIVMPKMGGFQLAEHVYDSYPGLSVIFVTGYMDDSADKIDLEKAKLIWKPFQKDELLRVVGESIGVEKLPSSNWTKSAPPGESAPIPQVDIIKNGGRPTKRKPPAKPLQPENETQPVELLPTKQRYENLRVLLVDDDEAFCRAGTRTLEQEGFRVVAEMTLDAARKALETESFEAIVLDVQLPDGNGLDLLEQTGSTPVVVVTGAPTGETAKRAVQGRVMAFLPKPVGSEELRIRVREAVDEGKVSKLRDKLLASRHGGNELIDNLPETDELFGKALSSLYMAYQPIVRGKDHSIYGYEALLRCREPRLSSPLKLLAAAEILDRVEEVGRLVRRSVANTMHDQEERLEAIFVNLNPNELNSGLLADPADPLLSLAPRIVLEITERVSLQSGPRLTGELKKLRDIGYRIAIDDLGEGYAGLSSLVSVQPDIIKIDMSLVRNLHLAPLQIDIVEAIIDMAHRVDAVVVGEGVEIKEERDVLVALGCDLLQGFYLGKPAEPFSTVNEAAKIIEERKIGGLS